MLSTRTIRTYWCAHCGADIGTLYEKGGRYESQIDAEWVESEHMYRCPECHKLTELESEPPEAKKIRKASSTGAKTRA